MNSHKSQGENGEFCREGLPSLFFNPEVAEIKPPKKGSHHSSSKTLDNLYLQTLALIFFYIKETQTEIVIRRDIRKKKIKGLDRYLFELPVFIELKSFKEYINTIADFFVRESNCLVQYKSNQCKIIKKLTWKNYIYSGDDLLFRGRLIYFALKKNFTVYQVYSFVMNDNFLKSIELLI